MPQSHCIMQTLRAHSRRFSTLSLSEVPQDVLRAPPHSGESLHYVHQDARCHALIG